MFETVTRDHVQQAIEECDSLGADTFQRRYGFGQARHYAIWLDGRTYDSKAILGVAQRYAIGEAAMVTEFDGGQQDAALLLRDLGLDVIVDRGEAELPPSPTDEEQQEAADLGNDAARAAWAGAAREILLEVAGRYQALVTYRELSGLVQLRTGIRTNQLVHYWIGDVLGRVARVCADRGEPLLSALCVKEDGSVGASYAKNVIDVRGELVGDPDDHAADERLACYRAFGAVTRGRRQGRVGAPGRGRARARAHPGRDEAAVRGPGLPQLQHGHPRHRGLRQLRLSPQTSTRISAPSRAPEARAAGRRRTRTCPGRSSWSAGRPSSSPIASYVAATTSAQYVISADAARRTRPRAQRPTSAAVAGNGVPSRRAMVRRTASSISGVTVASSWRSQARCS